jgi:hypothetical protein
MLASDIDELKVSYIDASHGLDNSGAIGVLVVDTELGVSHNITVSVASSVAVQAVITSDVLSADDVNVGIVRPENTSSCSVTGCDPLGVVAGDTIDDGKVPIGRVVLELPYIRVRSSFGGATLKAAGYLDVGRPRRGAELGRVTLRPYSREVSVGLYDVVNGVVIAITVTPCDKIHVSLIVRMEYSRKVEDNLNGERSARNWRTTPLLVVGNDQSGIEITVGAS